MSLSYKVVDHAIVLVLSTTVVRVKVDMLLLKAVMLKVQPTDNSVGRHPCHNLRL